jgi:hypothetical protein
MSTTQPPQHPLLRGYLDRRQKVASGNSSYEVDLEHVPAFPAPLLFASETDPTMTHVKRVADEANIPTRLITYESILAGLVSFHEVNTAVEKATGLYIRHPFTESPGITVAATCIDAVTQNHRNVIRPSTASTNWSKPLHLHHLRTLKTKKYLEVGESWITNKPNCNSSTLCKGMSHLPTIATRLSDAYWPPQLGPYMTQPLLRGEEFRLHVLDDRVFYCEIRKSTTRVDYRSDPSLHLTDASIHDQVLQEAITLSRAEGLRFSGIDLIQTTRNHFTVLEVNPMPGFHCYDPSPEFPIANELIKKLKEEV